MPPAAPRSRTSQPIVGVAVGPAKSTSWPVAVMLDCTAAEKTADETRPSWPTTIGPGLHPPAYAAANSTATDGSSPSPTTPRRPEMLAILVPDPPTALLPLGIPRRHDATVMASLPAGRVHSSLKLE